MAILNPMENIVLKFTEEQVEDIYQWFDENSKPLLVINEELTNTIKIEQLQQFLKLKKYHRRNFHYPTYTEIMKHVDNLKMGGFRMLTKEQFLFILNYYVQTPSLKHELLLAFKAFDVEKRDYLDMEDIKTIVTAFGDTFNNEEVIELMRDVNVTGDGNVVYSEFIDSMFLVAPELNDIIAEYLYDNPDEDPSVEPEPEPEPELPPPPPPPPPPPATKEKKGKKK